MSISDGAVLDRDEVPGRDVEAEIAEITGVLNAQHARLVAVVEHALTSGAWHGFGIHSPAQWLAWRAGLSMHHAREIVRIAERRASFPAVIEAFDRGELTADQVAVVVKAPEWADAKVAEFAKIATVEQLRRTMRSEWFEGDSAETAPPRTPDERDRLSFGVTCGHRWRINGEFDLARGALIENALKQSKDKLFTDGDTEATWADALVETAQSSLDAVESVSRSERYRSWLHVDVSSGAATTTGGWRIPQAVRDHLLCDGSVQPVWERDGVPFSVGRSQRIVPERTKRLVMHRDRGCRVPGCSHDRIVEIHHIEHWIDGGPTDTWNLICLCPKHHRLHHQGQLGIAGNADLANGVTFTDWTGRTIGPPGKPVLPTGPPPTPDGTYDHPLGGRMNYAWVGLGWIHPNELARRRATTRDT